MRVEPNADLHERFIQCEQRAHMLGAVLEQFAYSDLADPDRDTLAALAHVALELGDEIKAAADAYVEKANKGYLSRRPKLARLIKRAEAGEGGAR